MYRLNPVARPIPPFAYWEGAFTKQELDFLEHKAKTEGKDALVGGDGAGVYAQDIRRSQTSWVENVPEYNWLFQRLAFVVTEINRDIFGFDLTGFGEAIQLTNYNSAEQGTYDWHLDYNSKGISRKLSLVLQLTDPSQYEGGNLEIMISSKPEVVPKQRGLIALFPSYTLHRVTPVTKGTRQSLVVWTSGPAFK